MWAAVALMGHITHYGLIEQSNELGVPLLKMTQPAMEGSERLLPLPMRTLFVGPSAIFAIEIADEGRVRKALARQQPRRLDVVPGRMLQATASDDDNLDEEDEDLDDEDLGDDVEERP